MIERLTEEANKALGLAEEESRRTDHNFVGTEQILVGLLAEGTGIAARVLKSMGANLRELRTEIEKIIGRGTGPASESIPFTPRAKRVLELSWEEAKQLGHNYIGTEHLLLGLIRESKGESSKGVASTVLANCHIDIANLRAQIIGQLHPKVASPAVHAKSSISETPTLDQFSTDLTQAARENKLDPVVARDREINRLIRIIGRRLKANPLLIGERGVGKSAIIAGLAKRIQEAEVPDFLLARRIVRLDILYILAHRDSTNLIKECMAEAQAGKIILAIDEIHLLLAPGKNTSEQDASFIVNWFVAHSKVTCIGIAPLSEYHHMIELHGALKRHFQPIMILPPSIENAILMLDSLRTKLETHHDVSITDDAIQQAVRLSDELIKDSFLPDKAVDVLDEACQLVSLRQPTMVASTKSELIKVRRQKENCIRNQQFDKAATLREQETALSETLRNMQAQSEYPIVSADDISEVANQWPSI